MACLHRYGFRGNPTLVLCAKPKVGEREVSLSHITDWIERKLAIEFQVSMIFCFLATCFFLLIVSLIPAYYYLLPFLRLANAARKRMGMLYWWGGDSLFR